MASFRRKGLFGLIVTEVYESITLRKHGSKKHVDSHLKTQA